jgi:membrane fusion protein (multidrug efflux system)
MNAVSQMDLDAAVSQYEAAIGGMQSAEAQVKQTEIELSYCRIHSPIDGRIGISEVEIGEYVGGGNGLLNLVSQVDPIRVRFSIDEKVYLKLARRLHLSSKAGTTKSPKGSLELKLILADGSQHSHVGHVVTSGATIDSSTGTFTLEADFPNPNRLVLAGQYARIRGIIETRKNALLVPQRALIERQGGFSLFVVDSQGKVEQRKIVIGPKINKLQIISEGLKPTDRVVLEGVQKIRSGMTITPQLTTFEEKANQASSQGMGG